MSKRSIEIKQLKHDGHIFYFTLEAISAIWPKEIGFYFDDLGYPQKIDRRSVYGEIILSSVKDDEIGCFTLERGNIKTTALTSQEGNDLLKKYKDTKAGTAARRQVLLN